MRPVLYLCLISCDLSGTEAAVFVKSTVTSYIFLLMSNNTHCYFSMSEVRVN